MDKSVLRKEFIKKRISVLEKKEKSSAILKNLLALPCYKNASSVAAYASLASEADTHELIEQMLSEGKKVYLPKTQAGGLMEFYRIGSTLELTRSRLGIYEPSADERKRLDKRKLDLMIMPGVCFDLERNRIGFGGGYYDRYLFGQDEIFKVAICFDEQILKDGCIEREEFDVKPDIIVTDKGVYR